MNRHFVFKSIDSPSQTLDTIYIALKEDGSLWWNIDIPSISNWKVSNNATHIQLLRNSTEVAGLIFVNAKPTTMYLHGCHYIEVINPVNFNPESAKPIIDAFQRLDLNSIYAHPDGDILAGLKFEEHTSICWFNKNQEVPRKPASHLSRVVGETNEITKKWETIYGGSRGLYGSPDVYLLYLSNAYVLNGSLVFTSTGKFVGCSEQLGLTLAPWSNHASSGLAETDEMRFLAGLRDGTSVNEALASKIPVKYEDKTCFLYSLAHTGFGHHLGQSTPSSYFLNSLFDQLPTSLDNFLCLFRGGLQYESFRRPLFELSLSRTLPVDSLTRGLVRIPRLLVPGTLVNYGNHWRGLKGLYRSIRDKAVSQSTISSLNLRGAYKGLYLSRRGFARGCTNQEEISAIMSDCGFLEYVPPGSLPLVDQIALISQFKIIFAPYGSGANNVLFAQDEAHLIQPLSTASDGQSWDFASALIVDADYTYLFFDPDDPAKPFHSRSFTYNPDVIREVVATLTL